jgi:hypothetical protein
LLLPSAQRFISAVLENVKLDERTIGVLTGPLMPKCDSPVWMARVESLQLRELSFFMGNLSIRRALTAARNAPAKILHCLWANHNVQIGAEPIWRFRGTRALKFFFHRLTGARRFVMSNNFVGNFTGYEIVM